MNFLFYTEHFFCLRLGPFGVLVRGRIRDMCTEEPAVYTKFHEVMAERGEINDVAKGVESLV